MNFALIGGENANAGIEALRAEVDTLIVVPNERLLDHTNQSLSLVEAFNIADDVLRAGVQGITDLIVTPGLINVDFADVRSVMQGAGSALMGIGTAKGEDRAIRAAEAASPRDAGGRAEGRRRPGGAHGRWAIEGGRRHGGAAVNAEAIAFWVLATISVAGAIGVIAAPKAVYSAIALATTMIALAIVYVTLGHRSSASCRSWSTPAR